MAKSSEHSRDAWGITLTAAIGALIGVAGGFLVGEFAGAVDNERVRTAVRGLGGSGKRSDIDDDELEREVAEVLDGNPTMRRLGIRGLAVGNGVIELVGVARDESERELAATLVRDNTSAPVVVNRVLVEGVEVPRGDNLTAAR